MSSHIGPPPVNAAQDINPTLSLSYQATISSLCAGRHILVGDFPALLSTRLTRSPYRTAPAFKPTCAVPILTPAERPGAVV